VAAAQSLASREKLYRQSVLLVEQVFFVATGLWPVQLGAVLCRNGDGPQGRGYINDRPGIEKCAIKARDRVYKVSAA
jgi:hypothetical protein